MENKNRSGRAKRISEVTCLIEKKFIESLIWLKIFGHNTQWWIGNYNIKYTKVTRKWSMVIIVQNFMRERILS